jgi:hypothetical protein
VYQILVDLWIEYINPVIPDYIDVILNLLSLVFMLFVFFSPILFVLLIIRWIPAVLKGGKKYD